MSRSVGIGDTVCEGDKLPREDRIISTVDLMIYGGATWDWHRLHYDKDYVNELGLQNLVIDGQMYGALFARYISSWAGPSSFIQKLSVTYKTLAFAGDKLSFGGVVKKFEGNEDYRLASLDLTFKRNESLVASGESLVRLT